MFLIRLIIAEDSDINFALFKENSELFWNCRLKTKFSDLCTSQFMDFINKVLCLTPSKRPTCDDILEEDWLNEGVASDCYARS